MVTVSREMYRRPDMLMTFDAHLGEVLSAIKGPHIEALKVEMGLYRQLLPPMAAPRFGADKQRLAS